MNLHQQTINALLINKASSWNPGPVDAVNELREKIYNAKSPITQFYEPGDSPKYPPILKTLKNGQSRTPPRKIYSCDE